MKNTIPILLGILMLFGAFGHIAAPEVYSELIPSFIPEIVAHLLAAIAETIVGVALILPRFRSFGGLSLIVLMVTFLPIHVLDMLKEAPFIGSKTIAIIRVAIQFLIIYAGWWIYFQYKRR